MEKIWCDGGSLPTFPMLEHDLRTEVLVVGGGLTGLLCASFLQRVGFSVAVAEAGRIGDGVTGHTTAKITAVHGTDYQRIAERYSLETARQYYAANHAAVEAYHTLDGDFDLKTCDGHLFSRQTPNRLKQELAVLGSVGCEAKWEDETELPFPITGGIRIPNQAQLHPLKLLKALSHNLTIYEKTRITSIRDNTATTEHGCVITAKFIIVATHFPFINTHGFYFLKQYQHRAYGIAVKNAPKLTGMYWEDQDSGLTFRPDGNRLLVVGGGHRTGTHTVGWKAAEQVVRCYYPEATVTSHFATQDCMTLDGMPYIGRYGKTTPSLYVATGFNGWGMTGAMMAALIFQGELTGNKPSFASVFSPDRTIWHRQLAVNIAESTKGLVTPTLPRCPHLGCALKWNRYERSWDCACHGSRFSERGELRNGPSTGPLKR